MAQRILVIDDDPSIVALLTECLEGEGYHVVKGYDGQMAIHLARVHTPHLIVLDVNMPLTNGLKALEMLRSNEASRDIPIILLTGESSDKVIPSAQAAGRVMHIKKPLELDELKSLVHQMISRYSAFR